MGNTVIVVEHDEETTGGGLGGGPGPRRGVHGGEVVAAGTPEAVMKTPASLTGQFLSGARSIAVPATRRPGNGKRVTIRGARHHNLKNVTVSIPLGTFTCVTGVSGSGKSSLINEDAVPRRGAPLYDAFDGKPGAHDRVDGLEHLDKDHRHRPVAHRADAALEPGHLHGPLLRPCASCSPAPPRRARGATSPLASASM